MAEDALNHIVEAVAAGHAVDWPEVTSRYPHHSGVLRQLRAISNLTGGTTRPGQGHRRDTPDTQLLHVARLLPVTAAAAQVVAGLSGYLSGTIGTSGVPVEASALALGVFSGTALWLFVGGRRDLRAWDLGALLLLLGAAFAPRFIQAPSVMATIFRGLYPESFLPLFLWGFVRRFPRTLRYSRVDSYAAVAERVSVMSGLALFVSNVAAGHGLSVVDSLIGRTDPSGRYVYWAIIIALMAPAPLALVIRGRAATPGERRRLAVFSGGVAFVLLVTALEIVLEIFVPPFRNFMIRNRADATPYFFSVLLLLPVVTAYAVLVDSVLDVRVTIGRAARRLLARQATLLLTALPAVTLVWYLYVNRHRTVSSLAEGWTGLAIGLVFSLGLALTLVRDAALTFVDAHFDRPGGDLASDAAALTARIGNARSAPELAELIERETRTSLKTSMAGLYTTGSHDGRFEHAAGGLLTLPASLALNPMVRAGRQEIVLDAEHTTMWRLLPSQDLRWCLTTGVRLLFPVVGTGDATIGFLAVGAKASEEPFSRRELTFLRTIASAAALRLEAVAVAFTTSSSKHPDPEPATQCTECDVVSAVGAPGCKCGSGALAAPIPFLLAAKFQVKAYIGAGGMGVVYRAVDLTLGRSVALKTLVRLTGAAADRLASEARMMATVAHPNLATIYGVERWRRTPILVLEYLDGGSLTPRLTRPMPVDDVLRLGALLAPALEQLHRSGILHRDIKPSNIAFTRDDAPKLLDFGLASFFAVRDDVSNGIDGTPHRPPNDVLQTQTVIIRGGRSVVGTPLYLPPEALGGAVASEAFDIWALALVLFEAIAGQHPFAAHSVPEVLQKVRRTGTLDLRTYRRDCSPAVAEVFSRLLARDPGERPSSAAALRAVLGRFV